MRSPRNPWLSAILAFAMALTPILSIGQDEDNVPPASTVPPRLEGTSERDPVVPEENLQFGAPEAASPIGVDVRVNTADDALAEVLIDVNPTNARNLVICGHSASTTYLATYYTFDGGATWTQVQVGDAQDHRGFTFRFDPALAFDANGNVYVAYGVNVPVNRTIVVVCKSTDGGRSYSQTAFVWAANMAVNVPGNDKWVLATGRDPVVAGRQNVYIAWTWNIPTMSNLDQQVAVSSSIDGGATFSSPPRVINDNSLAGRDRALTCDPSVGPDGELYVSWHDFDNSARVMVDRSFDGGATWGTDVVVTTGAVGWQTPIPPQPDRGTSSGPVMDVDVSNGPHRGRAYIAYCHPTAFSYDILLRYSDDRAATWSAPVRVNDDATTRIQFLPWLDVGRNNGTVSVVFYDTREDPLNRAAKVYAAISRTGGESFEPNQPVADVPSNMSTANPFRYLGNYLEYIGVATGDCASYVVWTDNRHQFPVYQGGGACNYYFDRVRFDTTPPELEVTLTPDVLWPPDHRWVAVHATISLEGGCARTEDVSWMLVSVTSDEPEDAEGDGSTGPDIQGASAQSMDTDFELRAERSGDGDGRTYQVVYYADNGFSEVYDTTYVTVPHGLGVEEWPAIESIQGAVTPVQTALHGARPNPFNPETTVSFDLVGPERVRLVIANVAGARVRVLADENRPAGTHEVQWDGTDDAGRRVASGIYFVRMQAGSYSAVRKLVLLK